MYRFHPLVEEMDKHLQILQSHGFWNYESQGFLGSIGTPIKSNFKIPAEKCLCFSSELDQRHIVPCIKSDIIDNRVKMHHIEEPLMMLLVGLFAIATPVFALEMIYNRMFIRV